MGALDTIAVGVERDLLILLFCLIGFNGIKWNLINQQISLYHWIEVKEHLQEAMEFPQESQGVPVSILPSHLLRGQHADSEEAMTHDDCPSKVDGWVLKHVQQY